MEPFTIHCSSCQSRIRVRNPNMIGQIANCPKCGSMIMITAPQQILVDSGAGTGTDSVALTKESLPTPDAGLLDNAAGLETPALDHSFRFEGLRELASVESDDLQSLPPSNWLPEPTPPPRADEVHHARMEQASDKPRQLILVAAIGLCSVLLACGVFFAFLKWYAKPTGVAQAKNTVASSALDGPADKRESGVVDAAVPPTVEQSSDVVVTDQALTNESALNTTDLRAGSNLHEAAITPEVANAGQGAAIAAGAGQPRIPAVAATDQSHVNQHSTDQPSASQRSADASPSSASQSVSSTSAAPDINSTFETPTIDPNGQVIKETLPPGLQNFASIFDQSLVPVLSDATVPLAAAPSAGDISQPELETPAAASPMSLDLPESLKQKLGVSVSGLLIDNRPLYEALTALSLAGDIPITADLDGLAAGGVDRNLSISFKSTEPITIAEVLEQISSDYALAFEQIDNKLLIVRAHSDDAKSRTPSVLPIGDLAISDEQQQAFAAALNDLLPELAGEFEIQDGKLRNKDDAHSPVLWFQVARLLDAWRSLRGIENAEAIQIVLQRDRLAGWPLPLVRQRSQKKISQVILPEPLVQSWQRLSNEVGLHCWVDWPSLASAQISPSKVSMVVSQGRTFEDLAQYYANKYQMVFALEDEQTVWVSTPEMHRFQPRLYVLPIGDKSIDEWRAELEPLTPLHPTQGTAMLRVIASPDSQFVFIRCCRPLLAEPAH